MEAAVFEYYKPRILTAPIAINLELTSGCNIKCRHCYNFWREDSGETTDRITIEKMDELIDKVVQAKVFHIVLSGGEPFMNMKTLEYALKRLTELNISTSVNSNLMITTPEKMERLKCLGLDHILTSLNSYDEKTNDYMTNKEGCLKEIIRGIKHTIAAGIRVSANMIVSQPNEDHVYKTAELCAELGVQKIFATRLVPAVTVKFPEDGDLKLTQESALKCLDQLVRAKKDFGIEIGTLISYPLCLLKDLEKYKDFVGRGCPATRGNRMVINANGESHACTHEEFSYGNVFETSIEDIFKKMKPWHDGSYLYEECKDCKYINMCSSGCTAASEAYFGKMNAKDPLFADWRNITVPYNLHIPKEVGEAIEENISFIVKETIRFRQEEGMYTANVRWANAFTVETEIAEFLLQMQKNKTLINLNNMIGSNPKKQLSDLVYKEVLIPVDDELQNKFQKGHKTGCSVDPDDVPQDFIVHA